MTLLAQTPPGASADTAPAKAAPATMPVKFRTVEELRNSPLPDLRRGQLPPLTRLQLPTGVVDSTLSERGHDLAIIQATSHEAAVEAVKAIETARQEPVVVEKAAAPCSEAAVASIDPVTGAAIPVDAFGASVLERACINAAQQSINEAMAAVAGASDKSPVAAKKARRAPMTMVKRLEVLDTIRKAPVDKPDAELATEISLALGHAVGSGTVASYRAQLGVPSVRMPSKADLRAKLAAMEKALAAVQQPTLPAIEPLTDAPA